MFLHHVNNIELKNNIYAASLFYLHDTVYKNSKNDNVLINNINNLSVDRSYNPEVIGSVSYNPEVIGSVSHVSSEITNFQRDLFFKEYS